MCCTARWTPAPASPCTSPKPAARPSMRANPQVRATALAHALRAVPHFCHESEWLLFKNCLASCSGETQLKCLDFLSNHGGERAILTVLLAAWRAGQPIGEYLYSVHHDRQEKMAHVLSSTKQRADADASSTYVNKRSEVG
jgi:hypothetical protein